MKSSKWLCGSLMLLILAAPAGALADEQGIYNLGEVVVSGADKGVEKVGTTHTVTAKQIEERGARSLNEAINLVPGVQVRTAGDGTPRIDMRGFRTRHVTLLLNGTPFNATYDGQFDPALISVENIAEIKVTTGGSSMLYGPGGNAGIINIITKKGTDGFSGSVGAEMIEAGTYLTRGTASYATDKYDIFVSGSSYDRDRYLLADDFHETPDQPSRNRRNSDRERDNLFANIGFSPTDFTQVGLTVSYMKGERGKPPVTNSGTDAYAKKLKYEREDYSENFSTSLALSHDFTGPLSFKGWVYYNKLDLRENGYDDSSYTTQTKDGSFQTDSTSEIAGANTQLRYDTERYGAVTFGLKAENNDWRANGFDVDKKAGYSTFRDDADFQLYSVSLEYEVELMPKLEAVLGVGQHWQKRDEETNDDYSYLAGLSYQIAESTRLKGSHSRKVRFPSLRDLYDPQRGNTNLDAEVSHHYEVGVEQDLPGKNFLSITGFYADIEDYIEKPEGYDYVVNHDEYEFYGVEIAIENTYIDRLWIRAAYDYLHAEDKSSDKIHSTLQYRPEHTTTLEASYSLPWWGLSAYASARWVTDSYYNGEGKNAGSVPQKRLDNYVLADCRINKKTTFGKNDLDLYIGVNNLLDEDYEQSYGLPQDGQTFYGGINFSF